MGQAMCRSPCASPSQRLHRDAEQPWHPDGGDRSGFSGAFGAIPAERPGVRNYIDQELPFVSKDATVVTIFAGGNEVNTITAALGGGAGAGDQLGYIDQQVRAFGADLATIVNGIKTRAAARIVVLNLPNLAGLPYLAAAGVPQRQAAQRAAVAMATTVVNPLTSQGVAVVDLMCDPRSYVPSNYFSDGFHPNDAGYAFIASEVVRAITLMSYPASKQLRGDDPGSLKRMHCLISLPSSRVLNPPSA